MKWILKYIKGTFSFSLCFGNGKLVLDGYTNANIAGGVDFIKFILGYLMTFIEGEVLW